MICPPPDRLVLRDLSLPVRLVLSAFLLAVGVGYAAALVQVHFQHPSKSSILPTAQETVEIFHGRPNTVSTLQRLIEASEQGVRFNGSGTMSPAFTTRSQGWKSAIRKRLEAEVRQEREGEKKALVAWLRAGAKRGPYGADAFPLPPDWGDQPVTARYRADNAVKIRSILNDRCARCHSPDGDPKAQNFPLMTYDHVAKYAKVNRGLMSEEKLIQSTHVHLLGFATLFGMTGLVFALTSYPGWLRGLVAPLVLVAQVLDIVCWWLARIEGPLGAQFALVIPITGAVVGIGLMLHIVLGLFNMYGLRGKTVVLVLFLAAAAGTCYLGDRVVISYLQEEREERKAAQETAPGAAGEDQPESKHEADTGDENPAPDRR
jgi:hypothetical protein